MRPRIFIFAAGLISAALAGAAMVSAQTADERVERRRAVGGWLVEYVAESDGGLVVRMSRDGGDYRLDYHEVFWRGNYGAARSVSARRRDCGGGGEESGAEAAPTITAAELRRRFTGQLADCGAEAPEIAAALANLEQAFEIASIWTAVADATTEAEAAAIAAYGEDDAAMDANAVDEPLWTNSVEPQDAKRR